MFGPKYLQRERFFVFFPDGGSLSDRKKMTVFCRFICILLACVMMTTCVERPPKKNDNFFYDKMEMPEIPSITKGNATNADESHT